MVRTLATWAVFVLVSAIGLFALITKPHNKRIEKIAELRPYGAGANTNIVRHVGK